MRYESMLKKLHSGKNISDSDKRKIKIGMAKYNMNR